MAWLQNLAGRAEDLLNKIDKNAATVLSESNSKLMENETAPEVFQFDVIPSKDVVLEEIGNEINDSKVSVGYDFTFQYGPVDNDANQENNSNILINDELLYNHIIERKSNNGNSGDEIGSNVSDRSLERSDKISPSSSLHNSFILGEDSHHILQEKLEMTNQELNKKLLDMQHLYSALRNENENLHFKLQRVNEQLAESQMEKDQYMARAQKILMERETLFSIKQGNNIENDTKTIFATYNEELKKELEFHQCKSNELSQKNIQLQKEIQSVQMQHQVIQNSLQSTIESLQQTLLCERNSKTIAEEDCLQKNREIHKINLDISILQELLKKRDSEILKLKETVSQKTRSNDIEDMESRIASLTHTLMLKQNALETATTETHALKLQLEKLENEHKKNVEKVRSRVEIINIEEPDDPIPVSKFMRVSPFDAGVTRRVKHAYSTLDAISIRTGIFLRRYPVARVFVFCYMVLLHIWVLIILFLYIPSNR